VPKNELFDGVTRFTYLRMVLLMRLVEYSQFLRRLIDFLNKQNCSPPYYTCSRETVTTPNLPTYGYGVTLQHALKHDYCMA